MPQHRALTWLSFYGQKYPKAWENYAVLQFAHKEGSSRQDAPHLAAWNNAWPSWCWCPLAAAHDIIVQEKKAGANTMQDDTGALGAVAAWRATQGIYRIDPSLYAEIWEAPITGQIPMELLKRLPEWCCYVEVPDEHPVHFGDIRMHGFFVHLEYDFVKRCEMVRFALDFDEKSSLAAGRRVGLHPAMLVLTGDMEDALEATERWIEDMARHRVRDRPKEVQDLYVRHARERHIESETSAWGGLKRLLPHLLSLTLYLCADETDVSRPAPPPRFVKTKKKRLIMPVGQPKVHDIGVRIGAALRWAADYRPEERYDGPPTGRTVRGHIRRAHWHKFWAGPRDGERTLRVKFLPSIEVNLDGVPEPVIRPVK